jgi:hypothetical protein
MRRILFALVLPILAGCQQEMARQPAYRPLEGSTLFADGMASRPLVPGTVSRDFHPVSGKKNTGEVAGWERGNNLAGVVGGLPLAVVLAEAELSNYLDELPVAITAKLLHRGQQRFNAFCSECHDRAATGNGMVVQRGFTRPPNFHTDLSRGFKLKGVSLKLTQAPVGYFFEVITQGFGAMPDHASQVPPNDRWAIIAYIRALQLSQSASLADVPEAERKKLEATRGK